MKWTLTIDVKDLASKTFITTVTRKVGDDVRSYWCTTQYDSSLTKQQNVDALVAELYSQYQDDVGDEAAKATFAASFKDDALAALEALDS